MSPGFFLFIGEMEIRSRQIGYDLDSRQQERIVKLGHKTRIRGGEVWVVTMVMRCGGTRNPDNVGLGQWCCR